MHDLEIKSTGTLADELYTTELKIAAGNDEAKERRHILGNIIMGRMGSLIQEDITKYRQFNQLMTQLKAVLQECWNFQEIVASLALEDEWGQIGENIHKVAYAGKGAQRTNAERNRLIRALDELLGEIERTQLSKTYDDNNR